MKPDRSINICGEVCPYTFVKTKLAIEGMEKGQILEIVIDHLPAVENVPASLESEGHEVLEVARLKGKEHKIVVKKN